MWWKKRIYLDTAAATPVDKRVARAMRPYFARQFGNASSLHEEGVAAAKALSASRRRVAELIGAHADEIIFTSGGTEANNTALFGLAGNIRSQTPHILTTSIEHPSVTEPAKRLGAIFVEVGENGIIDSDEIKKALTPETKLVSVIYASNELGTIQPIRELAKVIRHFRRTLNPASAMPPPPYLHIDACQAPRFLDLNVERLGVDLMTLNGSKIYGPKGVGCLYVRRGVPLLPLVLGGGQERGYRAGTENVAAIVGFTEALSLSASLKEAESARLTALRERLRAGLQKIPGLRFNGHPEERLPHHLNISLAGLEAEQVVLELDAKGIAASAGSACSSNKDGAPYDIIGVRFSLGRETSTREIDYVVKIINQIVTKYARNPITKL
jgi:cysteine desulfurase